MNTEALIEQLKERDINLLACGRRLIVDAPQHAISEEIRGALVEHKSQLMALLCEDRHRRSVSPLADYAADVAPVVRFTVRETGDIERDFTLLHRLRHVIEEHQPGGNHVLLRIVTSEQRSVTVEWRAVAARTLRLGLARVLRDAPR